MYFFLLSYPILGAGIKYIDEAFDEKKFSKIIALALAPALGVLWAYTMLIDAVSATILLAVLCGVLFKGKIDNYAHLAGLLVILAITFLAGVQLMFIPLIILASSAFLDEVGNDFIDKNKEKLNTNKLWYEFILYFFDHRWIMKIAILSFVLTGIIPFHFFLAMIFFDEAYLIVRWYSKTKEETTCPWYYLKLHKLKDTSPAIEGVKQPT